MEGQTSEAQSWLSFRIESAGPIGDRIEEFKQRVPSNHRRWSVQFRYWLLDPDFVPAVEDIPGAVIGNSISFREDDRRHGRVSVSDDEELDTALIDLQYGDLVAGDGIGRIQGNPAARQEFERRLHEAERLPATRFEKEYGR